MDKGIDELLSNSSNQEQLVPTQPKTKQATQTKRPTAPQQQNEPLQLTPNPTDVQGNSQETLKYNKCYLKIGFSRNNTLLEDAQLSRNDTQLMKETHFKPPLSTPSKRPKKRRTKTTETNKKLPSMNRSSQNRSDAVLQERLLTGQVSDKQTWLSILSKLRSPKFIKEVLGFASKRSEARKRSEGRKRVSRVTTEKNSLVYLMPKRSSVVHSRKHKETLGYMMSPQVELFPELLTGERVHLDRNQTGKLPTIKERPCKTKN